MEGPRAGDKDKMEESKKEIWMKDVFKHGAEEEKRGVQKGKREERET